MAKIAQLIGLNSTSSIIGKAITNVSKATTKESKGKEGTKLDRPDSEKVQFDKFKEFNTSDIRKFVNPSFEKFSKRFVNSEPELLFVAEYFVDNQSHGVLVVWEKFMNASHYELFKKNLFKADASFERVLFLDAQSLEEETSNYMDYLKNTVGLDIDENNVVVILDTIVKEDRIYEYKIVASRVPSKATEVDYDFILQGKNLVKPVVVDKSNRNSLFDFSGIVLGSKELAWTVSILNETVPFFGRNALEKTLVSWPLEKNEDNEEFVYLANDLNDILRVINESVSLFTSKETYTHLLKVLGGLGPDFRDSFIESIDDQNNSFSYDNFRASIKKKVPVFGLVLQVAQTASKAGKAALSKLSIILPDAQGSESFASIESITKILNFVNAVFISILYSQDSAHKVQEILREIENGTLTDAIEENTDSSPSPPANTSNASQPLATLVNQNLPNAKVDVVTEAAINVSQISTIKSDKESSSGTSTRITSNGSSAAIAGGTSEQTRSSISSTSRESSTSNSKTTNTTNNLAATFASTPSTTVRIR